MVMRTGAIRYLFYAFLILLTDFTVDTVDWTPNLVGAAILLLGLRELCVFDHETGSHFSKAIPWAWFLLLIDTGKTLLYFVPSAKAVLPWLGVIEILGVSTTVWICGAGVLHMAVKSGQLILAGSLRQSIFVSCICCVSVACSGLLSAIFGEQPSVLSSIIITVVSLCAAVWFSVLLVRAQNILRPFFG